MQALPSFPSHTLPPHPLKSRALFEFLSETFNVCFNILIADRKGKQRRLVSMVGDPFEPGKGGNDKVIISVCCVTDDPAILQPELGRFSKSLAWGKRGIRVPEKPYPPSVWLQVFDEECFLNIFPCTNPDCTAIFTNSGNLQRHMVNNVCQPAPNPTNNNPNTTILSHTKIKYAKGPVKPRLNLVKKFHRLGYLDITPLSIATESMGCIDLETVQVVPKNPGNTDKVKVHFKHKLFAGVTAYRMRENDEIAASVYFRHQFESAEMMVRAMVGEWVDLAHQQKVYMEQKTASLQARLDRELNHLLSQKKPKNFFISRVSELRKELRRHRGTFVIGGYNQAKFDLNILCRCGLIKILEEHFGEDNVTMFKKDSKIILLGCYDEEAGEGLRFVDYLVFETPTSLEKYLLSHSASLPPGLLTKGGPRVILVHHLHPQTWIICSKISLPRNGEVGERSQ